MELIFKRILYLPLFLIFHNDLVPLNYQRMESGKTNPDEMTLRLELFTSDIQKTARFYQDVLGFELLPSSNTSYQPIRKGSVVLGIGSLQSLSEGHYFNPSRPETRFGYGVEIVLEVEDVQQAFEKARLTGTQLEGGLMERPWGLIDFRVVDPNGYYIRVTSKH